MTTPAEQASAFVDEFMKALPEDDVAVEADKIMERCRKIAQDAKVAFRAQFLTDIPADTTEAKLERRRIKKCAKHVYEIALRVAMGDELRELAGDLEELREAAKHEELREVAEFIEDLQYTAGNVTEAEICAKLKELSDEEDDELE